MDTKADRICSVCGKTGLHWRRVQSLTRPDFEPEWAMAEGDPLSDEPTAIHKHWKTGTKELMGPNSFKVLPYPDIVEEFKNAIRSQEIERIRPFIKGLLAENGFEVKLTKHHRDSRIIFTGCVKDNKTAINWFCDNRGGLLFTHHPFEFTVEFELQDFDFYALLRACIAEKAEYAKDDKPSGAVPFHNEDEDANLEFDV